MKRKSILFYAFACLMFVGGSNGVVSAMKNGISKEYHIKISRTKLKGYQEVQKKIETIKEKDDTPEIWSIEEVDYDKPLSREECELLLKALYKCIYIKEQCIECLENSKDMNEFADITDTNWYIRGAFIDLDKIMTTLEEMSSERNEIGRWMERIRKADF